MTQVGERRERAIATTIKLGLFLVLASGLLAMSAYCTSQRRSLGRALADLTVVRNDLQATADRLEKVRVQAESDKHIVLNVLGQCRSADDLPNLQSNRVIARGQGMESLFILVPEGSHTLAISSSWKPTQRDTPATKADGAPAPEGGEKVWRVPLLESSGYFFHLDCDRTGGLVRWQLTSNHPEFQPQEETLPIEAFSHRGSSWSLLDTIRFPNEIWWNSIDELVAATNDPPGERLMETRLSGVRHDRPYDVVIEVRIFSDAPARVSARDAQRIIAQGRADLLESYTGNGYRLRKKVGGD
jgi:hypothetical protein